VLRLLGRGGMGTVYLAEHKVMERRVALKVIRPDLTARPELVQRFQREAKAAARLAHPNVVSAYDAEQAGDCHLLVTEYVEGTDLACWLKARGPLPVSEACGYVRQAALGLQHAHEQHMVHRDLKPHNLMRLPSGQVKILDFGLALLGRSVGEDGTQSGAILGTPDYMAPEQANDAHAADIRADIYSLGCTLYELLSGRPPFPGGGLLDKLRRHMQEQPAPLALLRPELPAPLVEVVGRMMVKDPNGRYQTPAEVAVALEPWCHAQTEALSVSGGSVAGPAVIVRRRRSLAAGVIGVLLFGGLLAGLLLYLTDRGDVASQGEGKPAEIERRDGVVVCQKGTGRFRTLAEAVADVREGTRLFIRPGVYQESVTVAKQLEIVGEGKAGEVVIEGKTRPGLTVMADGVQVRNLSVRCRGGKENMQAGLLVLLGKQVLLEDCDITTDGPWKEDVANAALAVTSALTDVSARRCRVHDSGNNGLWVAEQARITIEECVITANAGQGIECRDATVRASKSKIHNNLYSGFAIFRSQATVEACDVFLNGVHGFRIGYESTRARLSGGCRVYSNRADGVFVNHKAQATVQDCTSEGNDWGFWAEDGGRLTVQGARAHRNRFWGVGAKSKGEVRVENCDLTGNEKGAVLTEKGGKIEEKDNKK